jgi:mono/diheme cytochrome c family protein
VIHLLINGARIPVKATGTGPTNGGRPFMPSFSAAYSDAEVADAVNYVTHRLGAAPSHLTALQVHALRLTN